ncbi:MAG TPA: endolytic transglycosylase MltG [Bryobacteraceae bacterium]|nr:endolytic transglycosylase MltG [Bryobacteraceae bacterium]
MRKVVAAILLPGIIAGVYFAWSALTPHGPGREVFVDIPPRTSTREIARMLRANGVIREEWTFLAVRAVNPRATLQAGEYAFDKPLPVWDVFRKIARGEVFYRELTVPEGSNMFDIAAAIEKLGFIKAADFLKVASDPALIRDLDARAPSLEGYLFPAKYRFTRRTTARQLATEMTASFRRAWKELHPGVADVHDTTTLASLVEKETAIPPERPMVAAVFRNRMRRGWALDCDPTVIYAALLEKRYHGDIHKSDLASTNQYNTYKNAGLPPGPIANPGLESLRAALRPAAGDYMFFVAKPDGSGQHSFSSTLAQHNVAVQEYRRGLQR